MDSALIFLIIELNLSVCRALACPYPYRKILDVCLHFPNNREVSWCDAQKYCSSFGGELVRGSNFLSFDGKTFSGMPAEYWIGMTDFLDERGTNRSGWRWNDGGVEPASSNLSWKIWWQDDREPNLSYEDCIRQCGRSGKICSTLCTKMFVPMCQPRPQPSSVVLQKHFEEVSISVGLSGDDFAQAGCSKLVVDVPFDIECALFCCIEQQDWCVSFYFNQEKKECVLVLYSDAMINVGTAGGWRKFVVKK